jgi:hypothetical protein
MYKLILFMLMAVFYMMLHALQVDEELAMHTLFRAKHALNRAAHAAAQQTDADKLARGIYSINGTAAEASALLYLQRNLSLDASNDPLQGSFLRSRVEVPVFVVVNEENMFPYHYTNEMFDFDVTLNRPGVIMVIRVDYPRTYNIIGPITWHIKGAAELVYDQ